MTLPDSIQAYVDEIKAALGVPANQLIVNLGDDGKLTSIDARLIYRPPTKAVDKRNGSCKS